jgi:hypothetical protein
MKNIEKSLSSVLLPLSMIHYHLVTSMPPALLHVLSPLLCNKCVSQKISSAVNISLAGRLQGWYSPFAD